MVASIEQLYAYAYQPRIPFTANNGWKIYDPIKEYQRMGVDNGSTMWRFTTINQDYKVCGQNHMQIHMSEILICSYDNTYIVFTYLPTYNGSAIKNQW